MFGRTRMAPNSLTLREPASVVSRQIFLVDSWMGPVFSVLQPEVEAPFLTLVLDPSLMSVCNESVIILNHKR
jgi:hypothetical protein